MQIPVLRSTIGRRMLVNFRADAGIVHAKLPAPFRPKLHAGNAIVGVCLIRLERIRPAFFTASHRLFQRKRGSSHRCIVGTTRQAKLTKAFIFPDVIQVRFSITGPGAVFFRVSTSSLLFKCR